MSHAYKKPLARGGKKIHRYDVSEAVTMEGITLSFSLASPIVDENGLRMPTATAVDVIKLLFFIVLHR